MASRERTLRKTQEIPSGHDPAQYVTKRLYAQGADGAQIPITLLIWPPNNWAPSMEIDPRQMNQIPSTKGVL